MSREKQLLPLLFLCLAVVTSLPYIYGFLKTPSGYAYTGVHSLNSGDLYSYLAQIEQAREGRLLLKNLHTPEAHPGFLVSPLWTLTGWLAAGFGLSNLLAFHIVRILAILLFLCSAAGLARAAFTQGWQRTAFLLMLSLSSGIGWLVLAAGRASSVDLWMPETIPFMAMAESPHFLVAQSMMMIAAAAYVRLMSSGEIKHTVAAGLSLFVLSLIHPFNLAVFLPAMALVTSAAVLSKNRGPAFKMIRDFVVVAVWPLLGLAYLWLMTRLVPVFASWKNQVSTPSPPLLDYLTGLGLPLGLAVPSLAAALFFKVRDSRRGDLTYLMGAWCLLAFVLCYMPIQSPRRVTEGVFIPVCFLAVQTLSRLKDRLFYRHAAAFYGLGFLLLGLSCLSNAHLLARDFQAVQTGRSPYYLPLPVFEAAAWLKNNAGPQSVILADPEISYFLPALTGKAVFAGHREMTIDPQEKFKLSAQALKDPQAGLEIMDEFGVDYLFELRSPGLKDPYEANPEGIERVFENDLVRIYHIAPGQ